MAFYKPSAFARRILRKLASGGSGKRRAGGGYQIGAVVVAGAMVQELVAQDLVEIASCGDLAISGAGRAFVLRNLQRAKGKAVAGVDAEGAENCGPYKRQHQTVHAVERVIAGRKRKIRLDAAESPLNWLAQRKDRTGKPFLGPEQVEAGERLRRDFTSAGMTPRMTPGYDGVPVSAGSSCVFPGLNPAEAQLSARRRFSLALASVGPELSDVLLRVCCFLEGIGEAERQLDWPARSGKIVLRIALDRLALHYSAPQKKERPEGAQLGMGMPAG